MSATPSVYALGTQPPVLKFDAGAGVWGSTPASLGMTALKKLIVAGAVQSLASHFGGDDAVKHLVYYLGNTGLPYTIDFVGLINEVPLAKETYDIQVQAAQAFIETLPVGHHSFTSTTGSKNHYILQSLSRNWFFAVGSYSTWGRGTATVESAGGQMRYTMEYEYYFVDRYNWDGGKSVKIPIPGYDKLPSPAQAMIDAIPNVNNGRLTVTDHFMGEFHRQGLAKEFEMKALVRKSVNWTTAAKFSTHKVQSGETLSLLAKKYYGDIHQWPRIHNANLQSVPNPNVIRVGQELKIPR